MAKKLFLFVAIVLAGACKENDVPPPSREVKRLVIAYMAADNNLDYFAVQNINDMEEGMPENFQGKLLVYLDRNRRGNPAHPCLMEIQRDSAAKIVSKIIRVYPEQNSADAAVLSQVISDAKSYYPDFTHMGLILWSHGSAWIPSDVHINTKRGELLGGRMVKSFAIDDAPADSAVMDIKPLAQSLRGNYFDFILFDACYMGCAEMGYELKDAARFLIASPTELLSYGFPYKKITALLDQKTVDVKAAADHFYEYYNSQKGILKSGSLAVINLQNMAHLTSRMNDFFSKIASLNHVLKISRKQIQGLTFAGDSEAVTWAYDLKGFMQHCAAQANNEEVNQRLRLALDEYDKTVLHNRHTDYLFQTLSLVGCNGLSTYIPSSLNNKKADEYYKTLSWYRQSGYDKIVFSFAD